MNKRLFKQLVQSLKEFSRIQAGKSESTRVFVVVSPKEEAEIESALRCSNAWQQYWFQLGYLRALKRCGKTEVSGDRLVWKKDTKK